MAMIANGLFSALEYFVCALKYPASITYITNVLNSIVNSNQQDAVVSIVQFPSAYINGTQTGDPSNPITLNSLPKLVSRYKSAPSTIGSYTPRNKKLLTYPYMFLTVDTLNATKDYKYEYFADRSNMLFHEWGCVSADPEILVMPMGYNGAGSQYPNYTESVTCKGFPQCAFVIDSYRAWVAQKSVDYSISQAQLLVKEMASVVNPNNVGGVVGAAQFPMQMERETNAAMIEQTSGSKVRGTQGSSSEVATKGKGIYYKYMSITEEFARRIDDFFDRFGYATGRIKVPNRNVRPHWTYTKTTDVAIRGNVPVDDMRKIKSIYNNGITFWRYGSEVGNYSLDNRV